MQLKTITRFRLLCLAIATLLVALFFSLSSSSILRGSLADDRVTALADTDRNATLSTREMRRVIVKMIQAIITHDTAYDLNLDSITHSDDLRILIQSIRDHLSAECGNGIVQAGEQCDDGPQNGQVCTSVPGASCTYCSTTCRNVTFITPAPSCLLDGLDAYWKLDETSGKRATSIEPLNIQNFRYRLSEYIDTVGTSLGKIGQAAKKNIEYASLISDGNNVIDIDRSFTIAQWVKLGSLGDTGTKYLTHANYVWYLARNNTSFFTGIGQNCPNCSSVFASGFGTLKADQWYFIVTAFDYQKNTISISVNGGAPNTSSAGYGPRSVRDRFGSTFALFTAEGQFGDSFDETGIWRRILTAAEISSLYNSGSALDFSQFSSCHSSSL